MLQCPEKSPSFAVLLKKTRAGSSWWCLVGRCSGGGMVDGLPDADGTSPFSLELTLERQQVFLR